MPHIRLEYTNNLGNIDFQKIFSEIHSILATITDVETCKSRAIPLTNYYIGKDNNNHAFIHVELKLLAGRSLAIKQQIGEQIMAVLKKNLKIPSNLNLQVTLEICDIDNLTYLKFINSSNSIA